MTENNKMIFSQLDGLNKTYAHYLLFKEDSPVLTAVLTKLVDTKEIDLYKKMFASLNKKHIRGGLETYVGLRNRFTPDFILKNQRSLGVFPIEKYKEMYEYSPLTTNKLIPQNLFQDSNDYANDIHSNQTMIDLIHEIIIKYIPTNVDWSKDTNINGSINKLIIS